MLQKVKKSVVSCCALHPKINVLLYEGTAAARGHNYSPGLIFPRQCETCLRFSGTNIIQQNRTPCTQTITFTSWPYSVQWSLSKGQMYYIDTRRLKCAGMWLRTLTCFAHSAFPVLGIYHRTPVCQTLCCCCCLIDGHEGKLEAKKTREDVSCKTVCEGERERIYQDWFVILEGDGLPLDALLFVLVLLHQKNVLRKEETAGINFLQQQ